MKFTEAEERVEYHNQHMDNKLCVPTYLMLYHDIRWMNINFDLKNLGF
jgi:hypothetical protein